MTITPCPACDGTDWTELPVVSEQSMLSDGRMVARPLHKVACSGCQLVRHAAPLTSTELEAIFSDDYTLYAHAPGAMQERNRQRQYAEHIASILDDGPSKQVLELGSGNGSLLIELQQIRPNWRLVGIEPVPSAATAARAAGVDVRTGFLSKGLAMDNCVDLVIAVNVLEHVCDPVGFLQLLRDQLKPGGRAIIICPYADKASSELLIFDHVHSFTADALSRIAIRAGFTVERHSLTPPSLGDFQVIVMGFGSPVEEDLPIVPKQLTEQRLTYLSAWQRLDVHLEKLLANVAVAGFGIGEAADLLSVYAPRTWSRLSFLTIDGGHGSHKGLPVIDYAELPHTPQRDILLAVRPSLQDSLAARIRDDGHRPIRWDDALSC